MRCSNCGKDTAIIVADDPITCTDCGSAQHLSYCVCDNCSFVFRTINGKFLDGGMPDETTRQVQKLVDELETITDEVGKIPPKLDLEKMTFSEYKQTLAACVRCGSYAVIMNKETSQFKCTMCSFEWEIV